MPNEAAMSNLRKTLHRLRQALDAPAPGLADRVVRITRQTVQFDVTLCAVDVASVRALLEASMAHPHRQLARCVPCLERLAQAVALYPGAPQESSLVWRGSQLARPLCACWELCCGAPRGYAATCYLLPRFSTLQVI